MKNNQNKVLPLPEPLEEYRPSPIVLQIGSERFDIHYEIDADAQLAGRA
jgi:hypothetical protein